MLTRTVQNFAASHRWGELALGGVLALAISALAPSANGQASFYTGSDLDHASDDNGDPWSAHQHHHRNHHGRNAWSGSLGLTLVHCLHRASSVVVDDLTEPSDELAGSVPCSSTTDTESPVGPPDTGLSLDGSVAYKLNRYWSVGASLSYEPAPGVLVPELSIDLTLPLNARTDWVQELSATSLYARGAPAPAVPEIIRLSEAINWAPRHFHVNAEVYADLGFGSVSPLITSQRRRPLETPRWPSPAAITVGAPSTDSVTTGFTLDGDRSLSKAWAFGVAVGGSARQGAEALPSPPTLVEVTPASLIWRRGPWSDTSALTMTAAHFGGPFNLAAEFTVQREL